MLKNLSSSIPKGIKTLWRREGRHDEDLEELAALDCTSFSFKTLASATHNFRPQNKLHEGYYGSFYKGVLKDGTEIAVNKLSKASQKWRKQFLTEVVLLSRLHHPNVVKLYGYCAQNNQLLIVYKYYPNCLQGLLSSCEGREQLNWMQRYKIIEGIANGLNYLHSGSQNGIIIHRDIKPSNIFLNQEWNPALGGFSLGLQFREDQAHVTTGAVGTLAYIAPDYVTSGHASVKTDVYNFGVTMLMIISGKGWTIKLPEPDSHIGLIGWAFERLKTGNISEIMDPALAESLTSEQLQNCIKISLLCTQIDPNLRPRMEDVVSMLTEKQSHIEIPIFSNDDEFVSVGAEFSYDVLEDEHQRKESPSNSDKKDPHSNSFTIHAQDDCKGHEGELLKKKIAAQNCQKFSYKTLYDATKKFASQNVLGQGGFGLVYKGKLNDGREIAVKKSSKMSKEHRQALIREVELLSRVKHPNLVKLVGYCTNNNELLLVYEYIPNKSLDKFLFGPNRREELNWRRTYSIIIGIAKGLSYLHDDPQNCIIHRDIKADNILIDHKWLPRIADFGISRLFDEDQTHVFTGAVGTWGYIAPEYLDHGHVSVKTDVYSFGVLVLELISGKRYSFMPSPEDNAIGLLGWAYKLFKAGRILEIMDEALADSAVVEQVKNCIIIGLLCAQGDPKSRPDMECIVSMLIGQHDRREMLIRRPGIYGYRGYHSGNIFVDEDRRDSTPSNLSNEYMLEDPHSNNTSLAQDDTDVLNRS